MDKSGGKFKIAVKPLLGLAVFFMWLFAGANSAQARTNIYAPSVDITTSTTWTVAGSPYVISGWAWLDITSTLTIDPGVVVKFTPDHFNQRYNGFNVSGGGKIIANGTAEAPVIFTSYYDDTASGDTNGDNSASSPVAGDWRGIILDADASEFSHVEVRYGANIYQSYGGIEIKNNSTASLADVSIKYSAGSSLRLNQPANPTITNITLDTSNDYGIYSNIAGSSINISNITINNCSDGVATLAVGNTLNFTNAVVTNTRPAIYLTGASVSANATWPKIGSAAYVLDNDISVPTGVTLTIAPGVVVKGEYSTYPDSRLEISGRLLAQGTADQPIIFTSLRDDTAGGDSNNDGSSSVPAAGDWGGLYFENSVNSILEYATIRYGGNYADDFNGVFYATTDNVMLHLKNSSLSVATSTIGLVNTAIYLETTSTLTLSGSTVATTTTGILSSSSLGSTISGSSFVNNTHFAISNFSAQIDARNNWWGDDSGPTIAGNPSGTGNSISSNVLYSPWTVHTPPNQPPTLSYVNTSGYTTDGVEPDISFKNSSLPIFNVAYSDPEGTAPNYINLIIASSTSATYALTIGTGGVYEYTAATSTFSKASYTYHFEASDGVASVRLPATGELSFAVKNIPVILMPGILGTELKRGNDLLWPDVDQMIFWFLDQFMNPLAMNTDGSPSDSSVVIGDVVRRPLPILYDVFSSLITNLQSKDYQENTDLFVFPYDWRLDIRNSSQKLKDKIDAVVAQTGSQKVDIIAHSMGGLVTKQYILDNTSAKIDKLVFVGTPHLGSPKSTKMLLFGDHLVKVILSYLNPGEMKYLAQNMASIYELLPSSLYFTQIGRYIYDLTNRRSFDYQGTKQYLSDTGRNVALLQNADSFHTSALDSFAVGDLNAYNIVGCDSATLGKILIKNGAFTETEYGLEFTPGDGTVPFKSANAITLPADKVFYAKGVEHATMPSQASIKQLISQIITGNVNISSLSDITQDINQCVFNGQVVSVYSPVDLHVYDSLGNHVGPNSTGDIELNIPGATYEQIGSDKFIFLPNASGISYNVELDGTGTGTFSLRVEKVENNEVTETAYYSDIPVTESGEAQVTLASNVSETVLQVDQSGTGSFTTAPVSAVLDSTQAADITKPTSAIAVSGGQTSATVSLSATDDNAGVLKIEYSLNNGSIWNTYGNSVIITALGNNVIQYRAIDRAGNRENINTKTIEITAAPGAVIISPSVSSPARTEPAPAPRVLGEEKERPANEQYTKNQILDALSLADAETLLDYLGKIRDTNLEIKIVKDYGKYLVLDRAATNFIAYGTKTTNKLGIGERAGVLRSYQYAFGKLPHKADDWQDLINIATSLLPKKRNNTAEQKSLVSFKKVYNRQADLSDEKDARSIMIMAYGLRPDKRDLEKEKSGLKIFAGIYRRLPGSISDWDIIRAISYQN